MSVMESNTQINDRWAPIIFLKSETGISYLRVPVMKLKKKIFYTDILDNYPNALFLLDPLYHNNENKKSTYKIQTKDRMTYVLKICIIEGDFKKISSQLKSITEEYEISKKLGEEMDHFATSLSLREYKINDKNIQVEILQKYGGKSLDKLMETATKNEIIMWIMQSLHAFQYMECRRISHYDIKPGNLVFDNGILQVIDMGCSIQNQYKDQVVSPLGKMKMPKGFTYDYSPPEFILEFRKNKEANYSKIIGSKVDIYCWAMTFFAIITNMNQSAIHKIREEHGFDSEEKYDSFMLKIEQNEKFLEFDSDIYEAIISCLQYDPETRPTFRQLLEILSKFDEITYPNKTIASLFYNKIGNLYSVLAEEKEIYFSYVSRSQKFSIPVIKENTPDSKPLQSMVETYEVYLKMVESAKISDENGTKYKEYPGLAEKMISELQKGIDKLGLDDINAKPSILDNIFINVADTYYYKNDFDNALNYYMIPFKKCIKWHEESSQLFAQLNYKIGRAYGQLEDYTNSISYLKKAYDIYKNLVPDEKVMNERAQETYMEFANICMNLGNALYFRGIPTDYNEELKYHENALNIYLKFLGKDATKTALAYNACGKDKFQLGEYKNALESSLESEKMLKKLYDDCDENLIYVYENIGECYKKLENNENALTYFSKALQLNTKFNSEINAKNAVYNLYIANLNKEKSEYDIAIFYYNEVLKI